MFIQIGQEIWNKRSEIHLHPYVKYDCLSVDLHVTRPYLTNFLKELPNFTKIRQIPGRKLFPYKYVFVVYKDPLQIKVNPPPQKKKSAFRGKQLNVLTL
jgi:hypothetical protein